jgi:hypothetical protein
MNLNSKAGFKMRFNLSSRIDRRDNFVSIAKKLNQMQLTTLTIWFGLLRNLGFLKG